MSYFVKGGWVGNCVFEEGEWKVCKLFGGGDGRR